MCDDFFDDFEDGFEDGNDWHDGDDSIDPAFDEREPDDEGINKSDDDTDGCIDGIDWHEMALFMAVSEDIKKERKKAKRLTAGKKGASAK